MMFRLLSGLAALGLAACGPPPEANVVPPERLRNLARPDLAPTAEFDTAVAGAGPDAVRLEDAAAALAARAEALRARAAALSAPAIEPGARERLEQPRAGEDRRAPR